jgi:hypothetical protein
MKKQIALLTLFLITLCTTQSLFGQEDEINHSKFGLGVTLFNLTEYAYESDEPNNSVYMTIDIGSKFRLEPVITFVFSDESEQYSIGIGGFGRKSISKFNILYGLRLGKSSNENKLIAPTIGGEYYFIKNFSIGSEVQLRGLHNNGDWTVFTNSSVMVRFYF